jgi:WD40 repeat protein
MAKEPAGRYQTAQALADDLGRVLAGEPIQARPLNQFEKAWRWCRRNRVQAGLLATAASLLIGLAVVSVAWGLAQQEKARWADEAATLARDREQDQERSRLLGELSTLRASQRIAGWSVNGKKLVYQIAALGSDDRLREQVGAILAGLDARLIEGLPLKGPASSVAFDPKSRQLLLGGTKETPARVWDSATGKVRVSLQLGAGPVALRRDGTPLQLVPGKGLSLLLWDVARNKLVSECRFPAAAGGPKGWKLSVNNLGDGVVTALAGDGQEAFLWDLADGRQIGHWSLPRGLGDTLVFHPRGKLLLLRAERPGTGRAEVQVFRIRNLLGPAPVKPICPDITDINCNFFTARAAPDASCFVIAGKHVGPDGLHRTILTIDSLTGKELWSRETPFEVSFGLFQMDPAGRYVGCRLDNSSKPMLVELHTGKIVRSLNDTPVACFGPEGTYLTQSGPPSTVDNRSRGGLYVWRVGHPDAKVLLDGDAVRTGDATFNRQGTLLAWGNADGSVSVCDLVRIDSELKALGLPGLDGGE